MKIVFLFMSFALIAGCATFRPEPISPAQIAQGFEARTLDNPHLKESLEKNLHEEITPWPPKSWGFNLLTLVALYYHPDLDVARAKLGVAEAGVITAGGLPNPSIGFSVGSNADAPSGVSPWIISPSFNIPIETAGKRGYRIDQAEHLSEAARLNIATVAWRVRSRLRKSLLELYKANQTEVLLTSQKKVQEGIVELLEQRLASGEIPQPEVTQAHISLAQTELSLREARRQKAEARVQVADALGLPASAIEGVHLSFDLLKHLPLAADLPSLNIQRQALFNRPDILSALAEYAAIQSALQLEIAKQYPDIHLGPGYKFDQGDNKWSLGISLTLPVLNRNQGPIAEAEARRKEAAARFVALQAQVLGEIDRATAGCRAALEKLEAADSLLRAQEKQQQSVQATFDIGQADRLALLSSQLELAQAQLSRLNALATAQRSLALLEDAVQRPLEASGSFWVAPETNPRNQEDTKK